METLINLLSRWKITDYHIRIFQIFMNIKWYLYVQIYTHSYLKKKKKNFEKYCSTCIDFRPLAYHV